MRTLAAATALGALVLSGTVLAPPTANAAETCHGQTATVIGTPGEELVGTAGADVIVTNGAGLVLAGQGDDLICVTGRVGHVNAGYGNDTVDATAREGRGKTTLGWGSDTFAGGQAYDEVLAGGTEDPVVSDGAFYDEEPDVIRTGAGGADVRSGQDYRVGDDNNDDVIVMGPAGSGRASNTVTFSGEMGTAGRLVFGRGPAALRVFERDRARTWLVDNRKGVISSDDVSVLRWSGQVHRLSLFGTVSGSRPASLAYKGAAADETFTMSCCAIRVVARMGAGHDLVDLSGSLRARVYGGAGADRIIGGPGNDLLAGGAGHDRTNGRGGVDTCRAEVTRHCERS